MLVQSVIVARGSGSIGGFTWSHGPGGQYIRARVTPTNPQTSFQNAVRIALAALNVVWIETLTQAERDDWAVYAANTPLLNPFGEPKNVSALNMYQRANVSRLQAGLARRDVAPADFNLGTFSPAAILFSEATGISVIFDNTDAWANTDGAAMFIYAGKPQNPSINFYAKSYRLAATILGNATTAPTSPDVTGTPPFAFVAGQKMFARVVVAQDDGRLSTTQLLSGIAVA